MLLGCVVRARCPYLLLFTLLLFYFFTFKSFCGCVVWARCPYLLFFLLFYSFTFLLFNDCHASLHGAAHRFAFVVGSLEVLLDEEAHVVLFARG